jgi:tetratricopeptide (TPR) repeat protein
MSKSTNVLGVGNPQWVRQPFRRLIRHRGWNLLFAVAVASGLCNSPVFAEDNDNTKAARQHYWKGDQAFKAGNYPEALKEFEAGFALANRPGFLLNMAHTHRRMNELKKARALYKSYLLADPESADRDEVQSVIKEIDSAIQSEETSQSDDQDAQKARSTTLLPQAAPPSSASGPGTTLTTSATTVPNQADGHFYGRWWFWTAVGAAVIGGVTAGIVIANRPHYDANGSLGTLGHP